MGLNHSPRIVTNGLVLALDAGNQKSLSASSSATFSNYFDGSSDWLNVGASSATQLTGDFTVEAWVWIDSTVVASRPDNFKTVSLFSSGGATSGTCLFAIAGNTSTAGTGLEIYQDSPFSSLYVTTPFPLDQWAHVAFVRTGSTVYGFINGTRHTLTVGAGATNTLGSSSSGSRIGSILNSSYYGYWKGFISNFRVLKGTALYTANFTPSTTPFTAITNTSLLTCQSATFIDNSTNNLSITTNGNVTAQAATLTFFNASVWADLSGNGNNGTLTNGPTYNSSNGGSIVFDGSNDYASLPSNFFIHSDSNPFSISLWFRSSQTTGGTLFAQQNTTNPDSASAYVPVIYLRSDGKIRFEPFWTGGISNFTLSNSALNDNIWHNLVATFSSGTAKLYIDGTFQSQITSISQIGYASTYYYLVGAGYASAGGRGLGTNYFTGNISNFKFYTKELVLAELQQNFNALRGRFGL